MATAVLDEQNLIDIANAIRQKNGTNNVYKPNEMANAINEITTKEDLQEEIDTQSDLLNNQTDKLQLAFDLLNSKVIGGITPTGTLDISENGEYNVTNYEKVNVQVAGEDLLTKVLTNTLTVYSDESIKDIKGYTFRNCTNLVTLDIPNVTAIRTQSFHTCTGLKELNFPKLTTLEAYAFTGCTNITNVNVPILTYAQASSFQNCSKLETIELPKVTQIGNLAFDGCAKLNKLILPNNAVCKMSNKAALTNTPIANGLGYVYVPDNLVESYKIATNWSNYATQIKGLSELG